MNQMVAIVVWGLLPRDLLALLAAVPNHLLVPVAVVEPQEALPTVVRL
jgi:hypothetical protein